ncbi:MAG: GGDEF domain-containing protein [Rhizobiaceae bacterium]
MAQTTSQRTAPTSAPVERPANPRAEGSAEFIAALEAANKAIGFACAHITPPLPPIYTVWYHYASGANTELKNRVDALLDGGSKISSYDLAQIHDELLTVDGPRQHQLDEANRHLDAEMADILAAVQSHLASSNAFGGSLADKSRLLNTRPSVESVKSLVEALLIENSAMRADTAKLGKNLEQSQTQIKALRSALITSRHNELTDPLTNIANRRGFQERVKAELAQRSTKSGRLCMIMADIDYFKRINDTYGHQIGDEVLRYFATVLSRNERRTGFVARYGGEEFAILLPGYSLSAARQHADAIRNQFSAARLVVSESKEQIGIVTASFGVAEHALDEPFESFIRRADANLYASKLGGRNRVT